MVLANPEQPVQAQRIANAEILIDGNAVESNGSPIKTAANVNIDLQLDRVRKFAAPLTRSSKLASRNR